MQNGQKDQNKALDGAYVAGNSQNNAKKPQPKSSFFLRAAGVALLLVVMSSCLVSGLLAKYVTQGNANLGATVAAFNVTVGQEVKHDIKIGDLAYSNDTREWTVALEYSGGVAAQYVAELKGTTNLPLTFTIVEKVEEGEDPKTPQPIEVNGNVVVLAEEIAPGEDTKAYVLQATADFTGENYVDYEGKVDALQLIITVQQV